MTDLDILDAEQRLLGSIVMNNEVYSSVCFFLRPFHFAEPLHRKIYEVAGYLIGAGKVAHPVAIKNALPADMKIGHLSIGPYLGNLAAEAVSSEHDTYSDARVIYAAGSPCGSSNWKSNHSDDIFKMCSDLEMSARGIGESPIEKMFVSAAILLNSLDINWFDLGIGTGDQFLSYVFPQEKIENYRVDFLVMGTGPCEGINIVVECDGHDFHERTPEQALRDRQRDRRLQALGYHMLRFTGSELYNRSLACASEVAWFMAEKSNDPLIRQMTVRLENLISEARNHSGETPGAKLEKA